uniref:C3H1-type domain-containing protein n=1 Tax=Ditylenchus dipsaci TaxID=166011 RepID=A0A915CNB8_9BILA
MEFTRSLCQSPTSQPVAVYQSECRYESKAGHQCAHLEEFRPSSLGYYKTVMCQTWLETANCRFGQNCRFAHGEDELRHVHAKPRLADNPRYKTRPCESLSRRVSVRMVLAVSSFILSCLPICLLVCSCLWTVRDAHHLVRL